MNIFGIGTAELLIVVLIMMVVAGPKRSVAWARQAGVYMRQLRLYWQKMMSDLRDELGEDGETFIQLADDLNRTARDVRQATSKQNIALQTAALLEATDITEDSPDANNENGSSEANSESRYSAWTRKPEDN